MNLSQIFYDGICSASLLIFIFYVNNAHVAQFKRIQHTKATLHVKFSSYLFYGSLGWIVDTPL